MKIKQVAWNVGFVVLFAATIALSIWGAQNWKQAEDALYSDGIDTVDANAIHLQDSGVRVNFSEVLLSNHNETRKLIVCEQSATITLDLTDRLIEQLDFDALNKTQKVVYTGKGYFVVDLDKLTKSSIIDDPENKVLTIKIGHSYLQDIAIDPNEVEIGELKKGWFNRGKMKLTLADYNEIEKELISRMQVKFNTAKNAQKADDIALQMVKEIYEPIVQAIDREYTVAVEFK